MKPNLPKNPAYSFEDVIQGFDQISLPADSFQKPKLLKYFGVNYFRKPGCLGTKNKLLLPFSLWKYFSIVRNGNQKDSNTCSLPTGVVVLCSIITVLLQYVRK